MSKICKNMRKFPKMLVFLDTFFWGTCVNSRKYMSRILCWGCVKIGIVSRMYDEELVEILDIVKWELWWHKPAWKNEKERNNARNKSRNETCHKETYRKETRYRKAYGYAWDKIKGPIARAKPRENEEAGTYPHYPGGRRVHTLFWKVRWSVWQQRLLLYERLP